MPVRRFGFLTAFAGLSVLALPVGAQAQDDDPHAWAAAAARGAFQLCLSDAPDADRVAEHGEIAGWPRFVPYLEHPKGYQREAGGESRRSLSVEDKSAFLEVTVQSGVVTEAAPANVRYFRCNVATDQVVGPDLTTYFTGLYGAPTSKSDQATVWLNARSGAAVTRDMGGSDDLAAYVAATAAASDELAMKAAAAASPGAHITRIELTRERGLDRAKLTLYENAPAR